jgi:hypothetical protein
MIQLVHHLPRLLRGQIHQDVAAEDYIYSHDVSERQCIRVINQIEICELHHLLYRGANRQATSRLLGISVWLWGGICRICSGYKKTRA